jgi:hypothetical protein
VGGTVIAKGEEATVSLASANRDPERFANADVFNIPLADANRHVAFGKVIHVCLGAPLARIEGQVALATLFRRYPELRLAVPAEEVSCGGSFLRGFARLPVLFYEPVAQRRLPVVPCDRRGGRWMLWSTSGGGDPILPLRCYPETYSRKSTRTSDNGAWARVFSALCN